MKTQPLVIASAALFLASGIAALFAPEEISRLLGAVGGRTGGSLVQLLAGALFALGMLNWMNRYATIGGIYGRPLVVTNFAFFFIATTTLARVAPAAGGGIALWGATIVCGVMAALYAWLFFSAPRGGS